ncbi:hypothetical protein ABID25_003310 [Mesorhizobium abyssinicae]
MAVSEKPKGKPPYTQLARTEPVGLDVWSFRETAEQDGIRCLGCFGGPNLFVALTWDYRENISDFHAEVRRCREKWDELFDPILPFRSKRLDDYGAGFIPV